MMIDSLNFSHFIRHYYESHIHFHFLHLLICLSSVGSLPRLHALSLLLEVLPEAYTQNQVKRIKGQL